MKASKRDNLIYLTVGCIAAALLFADFFYADSHGRRMWMPSKFAMRLAYSTPLFAYFLAKYLRKLSADLLHVVVGVLCGSIVHLVLFFSFREAVNELPGFTFAALAVVEGFALLCFMDLTVRYGGLASRNRRSR